MLRPSARRLRDSSQPEEECYQIIFGLEKPNEHNVELTSRNEVRELVLRAFETTPQGVVPA